MSTSKKIFAKFYYQTLEKNIGFVSVRLSKSVLGPIQSSRKPASIRFDNPAFSQIFMVPYGSHRSPFTEKGHFSHANVWLQMLTGLVLFSAYFCPTTVEFRSFIFLIYLRASVYFIRRLLPLLEDRYDFPGGGGAGIFSAFLGRGPRAFCFGNFFGILTEIGKISSIIFI